MEERITVLVVKPNDIPRVKEINNTLKGLQDIVKGHIECLYPWPDVVIICDEEGKLKGLRPNRFIKGQLIVGTFIIAGNDGKGDFRSLSDREITDYKKLFNAKTLI